ncbi:MAG: hypothetical protein WC220_05550 [Pedobacter sp.]|jgi:hypothetical protein
MPQLHNQINKLWYNPTYEKFKRSSFVKQIYVQKDSYDFISTGAFLIKMARKYSKTHIPWNQDRRLEILANPRLENALFSLGAEYLIKGVFLNKGFAVNKPLKGANFADYPIRISKNKGKLDRSDVQTLRYFIKNIDKVIDFTNFDNKQKKEEKKEKDKVKGQGLTGITRLTIPYQKSQILLDYVLFKRNFSLHRPFIMPEFVGLTNQIFDFLNYIAKNGCGKTIIELAKLKSIMT